MTEQRDRSVVIDPDIPVYQARAHYEVMKKSRLSKRSCYKQLGQDQEMFRASGMTYDRRVWWDKFVFCLEELLEADGFRISKKRRLSNNPLVPKAGAWLPK